MRDGPMLDPIGWWKKPEEQEGKPREQAKIIAKCLVRDWLEECVPLGIGARVGLDNLRDRIAVAIEQAMASAIPTIVHGQTCPKVPHAIGAPPTHYSHDDTPFRDWDGVRKCGRCHEVLS